MFCLVNVLKEKVRRIESYFFLRNRNNFKKVSLYTPEGEKILYKRFNTIYIYINHKKISKQL